MVVLCNDPRVLFHSFFPNYSSKKEYLDPVYISTVRICVSLWSSSLGFACHVVSPEISEKKVHALISKLGGCAVACIRSLG